MTAQNIHDNKEVTNSWTKKRVKRKFVEIEREAAQRTCNSNGSSHLPPLPGCKGNDESLGTLFSHPYGALPYGNIFMTGSDAVRHYGLGNLKILNDDQIISVFQFLDGQSLAKLVQTSRFNYVAGHHDELWRDLTLRRDGESGIDFEYTWRDTYVKSESNCECTVKHSPIQMDGIYSDIFFRSWLCRSFELRDEWLSVNNVAIEDVEQLNVERFLADYEEKNTPLIIKGATASWKAVKKWDREYLIEQTKHTSFRATSGAAPLPAQFSMKSYFKYCDSAAEEAPLYLFDRTFSESCSQLLEDYVNDLKKTCPYFDDEAAHGHDLFSLLGNGKRPDHRWIIIGPKRSGSSFHIDPNATHAWNAPIRGRKRWIFYPPGCPPPGVFPSADGDDVIMPLSLGEWFLSYFEKHVQERSNPDQSKRPLECTVEPGDILFVPHGWWHCVLNLDDGIALTQNYVSQSNLSDVLRFLDKKPQQISGCRDRSEAIQPDKILRVFKDKLNEKLPHLVKEAEDSACRGWMCEAWTDDIGKDTAPNTKKVKKSVLERAKIATDSPSCQGFSFSFM